MNDERRGPLSWLTNRTIESVDLDEVLAGVDVNAVVGRLELNELLDRVDMNRLLDKVDMDRLLDQVDMDRVLDRVDVNQLLDRVDVNRVLDRVEPDRLMDRVDVDRIMARVDVAELVDRAGVADIVADSTGAVAGSVLDVARRQIVAIDTIVERPVYRITGRDPEERPRGPAALSTQTALRDGRGLVTGTYAGPVSRTLAFALDAFLVFWVFTAASAGVTLVLQALGVDLFPDGTPSWVWIGLLLVWGYAYWFVGLALTGRTVGKAVVGLKVLANDGTPVTAGEAALRTLFMPLSFVFLLGLLPALFTRRRRTLHDLVGRTCEVFDWGDRPAEMPAPLTAWLVARGSQNDPALPE